MGNTDPLEPFPLDLHVAVRILDEETLIACSAYVDLNPISICVEMQGLLFGFPCARLTEFELGVGLRNDRFCIGKEHVKSRCEPPNAIGVQACKVGRFTYVVVEVIEFLSIRLVRIVAIPSNQLPIALTNRTCGMATRGEMAKDLVLMALVSFQNGSHAYAVELSTSRQFQVEYVGEGWKEVGTLRQGRTL